ncbi:MAG: hypothetical protein NVSMB2_19530 [Chloroflexota bacterium]
MQAQSRLLRALYALSPTVGAAPDPAELVQHVAERACELLGGDAVALYLWDDQAGALMPVFTNDPHQETREQPLRLDEGAAGKALARREPVLIDDYPHWEHAVSWAIRRNLQAVQAVPLMVGERPIGALVVRFYTPRKRRVEDNAWLLSALATQIAPALEAARLYAASNLEREHERVLREVTQALAANLEEQQVLSLAVTYATRVTNAAYGRIWLVTPNGELVCAAAEGFVHAHTFERRLAPNSTSGRVARQRLVNLAHAPSETGWFFNRDFGERTGLGSYLGAGLWRAGESLGVLEVMREPDRRFTAVEEQMLLALASAVAVAVSNARIHAEAERLALEARRKAERAAESELTLRSIYEAIGSGVIVLDHAGYILTANAAAADILGRPVSSLIGLSTSALGSGLHPDTGAALDAADLPMERAINTGQAVRKVTLGVVGQDGRTRWLQTDAVPIVDSDGAVDRVIVSFVDITDQRRSQSALRRRDAILEAVAFAAEQLLSASDWERSIDEVLGQLGRATGVSRVYIVPGVHDDGSETGAHEWNAPGVQPSPPVGARGSYLASVGLDRWEPILRSGGTIQGRTDTFPAGEQARLQSQGVSSIIVVPIFAGAAWWGLVGFDDCVEERLWPSGAVEVLKTAAGTLGAAIVRRQAEAERLQLVGEQAARAEAEAAQGRLAFLAEASAILATSLDYELTLQGVADLVVPAHADCCFIDVHEPDGSIRRAAASVSDTYAERVGNLIGVHTDPHGDHPIAQVIRTGVPRIARTTSEQYTRRAARHFASALLVPLLTRVGVAGAMTWLISDERRAFGDQDLDLAVDLGRRCALAIDNARLYAEARAAVSVRDEFMSVAAHELKTPMTSLRGYAQLLAREFERGEPDSPERVRRAASTIQVQSDKLARLIGQLLDVSRIQSGKLAIERRSADMSSIVREVIEAMRSNLSLHTIVDTLPEQLRAPIDMLRIEQVLTNLIDNAIKYSPDGGPIEIDLSCDDEMLSLRVRDYGVGVPVEHRPHIFDRFYQAHAGGPLTSMAGMGLGLYISRQIVELHGGQIYAEFPDDGGTRMVFLLPLG